MVTDMLSAAGTAAATGSRNENIADHQNYASRCACLTSLCNLSRGPRINLAVIRNFTKTTVAAVAANTSAGATAAAAARRARARTVSHKHCMPATAAVTAIAGATALGIQRTRAAQHQCGSRRHRNTSITAGTALPGIS